MEANDAKALVLSFIDAINKEDFETAAEYVNDNFTFDGVLGYRDGAEAYFKDMRKMKFKYDVIKAFADGDDVCVLYNIDMGSGEKIFTCGWYRLMYNKLNSLKVVFDPRPVLEKKP